jgi:phenylalanyl-tRNA synthetase beta chain
MSEIGFLLRNLGLEGRFKFESVKTPEFIEGRSANILIDGEIWGSFGEVSPDILTNFGIGYPVVAFEIFMPRETAWIM